MKRFVAFLLALCAGAVLLVLLWRGVGKEAGDGAAREVSGAGESGQGQGQGAVGATGQPAGTARVDPEFADLVSAWAGLKIGSTSQAVAAARPGAVALDGGREQVRMGGKAGVDLTETYDFGDEDGLRQALAVLTTERFEDGAAHARHVLAALGADCEYSAALERAMGDPGPIEAFAIVYACEGGRVAVSLGTTLAPRTKNVVYALTLELLAPDAELSPYVYGNSAPEDLAGLLAAWGVEGELKGMP